MGVIHLVGLFDSSYPARATADHLKFLVKMTIFDKSANVAQNDQKLQKFEFFKNARKFLKTILMPF